MCRTPNNVQFWLFILVSYTRTIFVTFHFYSRFASSNFFCNIQLSQAINSDAVNHKSQISAERKTEKKKIFFFLFGPTQWQISCYFWFRVLFRFLIKSTGTRQHVRNLFDWYWSLWNINSLETKLFIVKLPKFAEKKIEKKFKKISLRFTWSVYCLSSFSSLFGNFLFSFFFRWNFFSNFSLNWNRWKNFNWIFDIFCRFNFRKISDLDFPKINIRVFFTWN